MSKGIPRAVIEGLRFYKETTDGKYIFVQGVMLVRYSEEDKSLRQVNKDGSFV